MGIKAALSKPYAHIVFKNIQKWAKNPVHTQEAVFENLIASAKFTEFGKDHNFEKISNYHDFKKQVPLRDYEALKPYIDRSVQGERDILWPGKPLYFCKTSGTTSGSKFIPISKDSISNHIHSARNALLCYIHHTKKTDFVNGKMIFLQGSPELSETNGVPTGRLSGIVAHHVPKYLTKNRMPSFETNCIDDWETKVENIVRETLQEDMTLISGIPPWVQQYFEKLIETSGKKTIREIFPNFSLFVYGGVNYRPYRAVFEKLIGDSVDSIETYPASEGFIAFQDHPDHQGLLLILNKGIFYEFVPLEEVGSENPTRLCLEEVELGVNYALILNTNAGLWGYSIGDTVKFVSKSPYRIIVSGRVKHYTSAFGEHVIAEEVEYSMQNAAKEHGAEIVDFHVCPNVSEKKGASFHQWFVEFSKEPKNIESFRKSLDQHMCHKNVYYKDLIDGGMLNTLHISKVKKGGFLAYMKSKGKLGGQNKPPRLANDRKEADVLQKFLLDE